MGRHRPKERAVTDDGPLAGGEHVLKPGTSPVSITDIEGRIVHCDPAFLEVRRERAGAGRVQA